MTITQHDSWADELARRARETGGDPSGYATAYEQEKIRESEGIAAAAAARAAQAAAEAAEQASVTTISNLAALPWAFNPPMHPSLRYANPDLKWAYTEGADTANSYATSVDFSPLRLGRIYMGKFAMSFAAQEMGTRFGFRFLYNPSEKSGGMMTNADFIVNPSVTTTAVIQDGLESINLEIMLNRMPELQGQASAADYSPAISEDDLKQIRKYGTHWDLEYLYRVCNGLHRTRSNDEVTGDIGILLPNPSLLRLGPHLYNGAVETVQANDTMFTADMVPMLTTVSLVWRRYIMTKGDTIADINKTGSTTTTDPGTSSGPTPPATNVPTGGNGWSSPPSLVKLSSEVRAHHPKVGVIGSYRKPDGSTTEHSPVGTPGGPKYGTPGSVHALDLMINVSPESMKLLNLLVGQQRLQYLIHDRKIWSASHGWVQRAYTGPGTAHTDHIHVSLANPDQARAVQYENDASSWNI